MARFPQAQNIFLCGIIARIFSVAVQSFQAHCSTIKFNLMQCGAETKIPHKI